MGGGNRKKKKKTKTYTKAQLAAQKRIADKKNETTSTNTGTKGIGPVRSGDTYAKSLQTSTSNQVKKDNKQYGNTVPSGSFGISQAGRDQAAINRGIAAAAKTGIPSGKNLKPGSFGISSAGKKQAERNRQSVKQSSGPKFKEAPKLIAEGPKMLNPFNIFQTQDALKEGEAAREGVRPEVKNPGFLDSILNINSEKQRMINELSAAPQQTDTQVAAAGNLGELGIGTDVGANYFSIKSPETFGAPSQEAVDAAAGITAGGLNIGGSGFTPSNPSGGANARAIFPGASPNSVLNDPNFKPGPVPGDPFAQPGPGGPEPESDYTSYQPGSYYNQSDTNMNLTNALRSTRNIITTPARMLGIDTGLTNMLIPKSNEAIQDARDQRSQYHVGNKPRPKLRKKGGGGARLPVAAPTPEEILLPEETAAAQTAPSYQQVAGQTGVDPNRLLQIQQDAYQQAFNPSYNAMFRFFDRRRGARTGAFRKAFRVRKD